MSRETIARILYTADGEAVTVNEVGNDQVLNVESQRVLMLLREIREELKILNLHMSQLTDEEFDADELDEEIR